MFLSLTPSPPDLDIEHGDKLGHLAGLRPADVLVLLAVSRDGTRGSPTPSAWIALGIALEFAQGATGYRSFEVADMAANSLGVLLGWGISATLRR